MIFRISKNLPLATFIIFGAAYFQQNCVSRKGQTPSQTLAQKAEKIKINLEPSDLALNFFEFSEKFNLSQFLSAKEIKTVVENGTEYTAQEFVLDGVDENGEDIAKLDKLGNFVRKPGEKILLSQHVKSCLLDGKNWFPVASRLGANEYGIPGPVDIFSKWADSKQLKLDKLMQLRITFRSRCKFDDKKLSPNELNDSGLHVIYFLSPKGDAVADIFAGKKFTALQLAGSSEQSRVFLENHAKRLNSAEYQNFRNEVLKDWAQIAVARISEEGTSRRSAATAKILQDLETDLGFIPDDPINPGDRFLDKGLRSGSLRESAWVGFVTKYAVREQLAAVASMFGEDGGNGNPPWVFASVGVNPDTGEMFSQLNRTIGASIEGGNLLLFNLKKSPAPVMISGRMDHVERNAIAEAQFKEHTIEEGDDKTFSSEIRKKLMNVEKVTPTSTTCHECHLLGDTDALNQKNERTDPRHFNDGQYGFRMLGSGKWNLRTIAEINHEANLLKTEFPQGLVEVNVTKFTNTVATTLKRSNAASSSLSVKDKCDVAAGTSMEALNVTKVANNHLKLILVAPVQNCEKLGKEFFVFADHF